MKKAFTLIELVVAIALLTMVISFASVIFNVSIDVHRTSAASAEIMQKFRAITDQFNRDFKGLQKDAPLLIWFQKDGALNRFDQIMFFAAGDFQSTQLYDFSGPDGTAEPNPVTGTSPLVGNVARIRYAQAQPDPNLLARRQHILSADTRLFPWPDAKDIQTSFDCTSGSGNLNEVYEHDSLSLAQWKTIPIDDYVSVVNTCFYKCPWLDKRDPITFHKLMCEGVGSFAIQWAYRDSGDERFYWFPSVDPDGDGSTADSHFVFGNPFGVYFNVPGSISVSSWVNGLSSDNDYNVYPVALKFTFTLYDSKGIIKNGKEFTHIVYLGN